MACTIVVKLLGRNIEYSAFHNKVCSLWKSTQLFQLMDVENGYFLAKFQNSEDFEKVLCQGLWIVYDQYLMVQPWTVDFSTTKAYPSMVMELCTKEESEQKVSREAMRMGNESKE
ncbi:hypothetical protein J1N35_034471 [Gossypium stocksii]|uniref:DUF4283 domain-containing protein n=1 Tax=Gossypium stocksii TaxID=47602 RepID=A0A9D3ZP96_9ROSI|nr:hypothetical protein J1N35_034471 [Gossypium stocksii]